MMLAPSCFTAYTVYCGLNSVFVLLNNAWSDPFYSDFHREMHYRQHVQHLLPSSLNKGHLFDTCFFGELLTSLLELHTAIILNMPLSINDSITQNQQHACHDCWVIWFSITVLHVLVSYLLCGNVVSTKDID